MAFLHRIEGRLEFDLWGRGFTPIPDKWDGVAPHRYSLAIENFSGPDYWTEKIADCFLSWTMPIYYGCTNIEEYFPKEALVRIDIASPDAVRIVEETMRSDLWRRSREAIAFARELVLEKHQFFPFVSEQIRRFESANVGSLDPQQREEVRLPAARPPKSPLWLRVRRRVSYLGSRVLRVGR